ncbi:MULTISPECIES: alpha/beta hydrolase [unclassified Acinetobacter]|uniref:alpha/beta hydrolase n=1 Tax=unclassified Acinetobacter TaxID=196816 RepID=UPI001D0E64B3|nr:MULTISPECIES: alpha/beta hydrolase [unclassified Acinetobacter]
MKIIVQRFALVLFLASLTGCQNLPTTLVAKLMDNQQTQENVKYLEQYAHKQIQQKLIVQTDIHYGQEPRQRLDILYPENLEQRQLPVIFLVHGGGWVAGSKEAMLPYAQLIADRGFLVVNVEYTLVPRAAYPQQVLELNQAVDYVMQHQDQLPLDSARVFFSGDSAGANIVSSYVAALNAPEMAQQLDLKASIPAKNVKGLVLHSGVYDLKTLYHSSAKAGRIVRWGAESVIAQYSGYGQPNDHQLDLMSAYPWVNAQFPPIYVSATEVDLLTQSQTKPFIKKLKQLGVQVNSQIYSKDYVEKINHDFNFNMRFKASREVFDQSIQFLKQQSTLEVK